MIPYDPSYSGAPAPEAESYADPNAALGPPDDVHSRAEGAVAVGQGGRLELAFDGCLRASPGADIDAVELLSFDAP